MGDAFNNFVAEPLKNSVVDSAVEATGLGGAVDGYNQLSNDTFRQVGSITRAARFVRNNFFN